MQDPFFVDELAKKIQANEPLPAIPSIIYRKKIPHNGRLSILISVTAHCLILFLLFFGEYLGVRFSSTTPLKRLQMKSAIRVETVDLPSMTVSDLAKLDVLEDVGEPKKELPKENQDSLVLPDAKIPTESVKKEPMIDKNGAKRLTDLRAKLRSDARRKELVEKITEKKAGRAAMAGNILSQGYATTGDIASEIDAYQGLILAHVRKNWEIPAWMSSSTLKARVLVMIAPDGRILSKTFLKRSGNADFDKEVDRALEKANPLPKPPDNVKARLLEEGVEWGFPE